MAAIIDRGGNYRFLPKELRDFHAQKELVKKIYEDTDYENMPLDNFYKIGWTQFHVNMIDVFLYNMALRGYALKKDDRFKEIGLLDARRSRGYEVPTEQLPAMEMIEKAERLTDHIDAVTISEKNIKKQCLQIIIDLLESNNK